MLLLPVELQQAGIATGKKLADISQEFFMRTMRINGELEDKTPAYCHFLLCSIIVSCIHVTLGSFAEQ